MDETAEEVFVLPATPNQIRFWSLDQILPGNPALNMPLAWSCQGELDPDLVSESLSELVRRHESLRTTFDVIDGAVSQIVQAPYRVPVPCDDLSSLPAELRKEQAEERTRQEARMAMDLKKGPLFFGRLLRLQAQEHILLVTIHHSICDGWSNGVLLRDFAAVYDSLARKVGLMLPALDIQFGDYAVWLDEWRKGPEPAQSLEYWRKTLGQDFTPFRMKHDSEPEKGAVLGDIETLLLPPRVVQMAREFCASQDITQYMLLLAVYSIVLSRLTGLQDMLIGSPSANRRPGTENLIGPFANPQVMRSRFEPGDTFRSVLDRVRAWTLGSMSHQDLPFEDLIEDPFFSGGRNQINLPVYFVYQKAFMQAQHSSSLNIVPIRSVSPGTSFELMLSIVERTEGPRLQLEYNPSSFRLPTIQRILRLYARILEAGIRNPSQSVQELDILDEDERELVLHQWNRTETDFGPFESVHRMIAKIAAHTPGKIAVSAKDGSWTYRQVEEYSNQLAHFLNRQGLGHGSLIAVCVPRSLEVVGVLLGILKSGAAYLPLDSMNPSDRLSRIAADAQVTAIITGKDLASLLKIDSTVPIYEIESRAWLEESVSSLDGETSEDSLAYVIYTSGSTGKPKGVAIEHGALTNLLRSMQREPGMTSRDTLVSVTTLSFDISALELFLPLIAGARVVIASNETVRDGHQLRTLLLETGATILQSTPSVWRLLIEAGWQGKPHLKVLCGGEAMPPDLAEALRQRSGEVWNLYGPTETTIWSSATRVAAGPIRIGPPISNTQLYVLDEHLKPVPVGVTGELFIGGKGLARGYWHNPELTALRFVDNPFGAGRIYRTGDVARWSGDGSIELLGRTDHQVKIRGYRIELGEIEAELATHPEVRDAVVMAVGDTLGHKRLAAWVDSKSTGPAPDQLSAALHAQLASRLPEYMLPVTISVLPALPRTSNGKIDQKSLPEPDFGSQSRHRFVKPRNETERRLLTIWQSVLGLETISVEANFFELGGNSLMILRLIARVNTAFQSLLPIPIIYTAPTIEKMAGVLGRKEIKDFVLALQPNGSRPPLFMIQSYHLYRTLPATLGGDQPFYGVRELELEDRTFPYLLDDLIRKYVQNIREIQPHGPYYLSGFCFFALLAFAVAGELESQGEEVAFLGLIDANCPYYWRSQAPKSSAWARFKVVMSYHWRQIRKASPLAGVAYAIRFAAKKIWNRILSFSLWIRNGAYGYFMTKHLPLPKFMMNKAMVTRVAVRMHTPKKIRADIYLFPAADQPYPDDFDATLGWSEMTAGQVKTIWLPGSHEDMFLESNMDVMAQKLGQAMNEVEPASAATALGTAS